MKTRIYYPAVNIVETVSGKGSADLTDAWNRHPGWCSKNYPPQILKS